MTDSENYFHNDEMLFSKMLSAYSDLYNKACSDKNYVLCDKLRMEFSCYANGYRPKITIETGLCL